MFIFLEAIQIPQSQDLLLKWALYLHPTTIACNGLKDGKDFLAALGEGWAMAPGQGWRFKYRKQHCLPCLNVVGASPGAFPHL